MRKQGLDRSVGAAHEIKSVADSFVSVSSFFETWVRIMEIHTRRAEVEDLGPVGARALIVSPPTDAGIPLLVEANRPGKTTLLCFSEELARIAKAHARKRGIEALDLLVAPFFRIPFSDGEVGAVYANCFFDFCSEEELEPVLREVWRVLQPRGSLFAVYMAPPSSLSSRFWAWLFRHFGFLSHGCHPISLAPHLSRCGFQVRRDLPAQRFGFPARYTWAEKQQDQPAERETPAS